MDRFLQNKQKSMSNSLLNGLNEFNIEQKLNNTRSNSIIVQENTYPFINSKFIPKMCIQPYRQLKIDTMADDFYSSLIDWAKENVFFAVDNNLYSHNFYSSKTSHVCSFNNFTITSIKCNTETQNITLGTSVGVMLSMDMNTQKVARYSFHRSRIGVIETEGSSIITGSRDRKIKIIDLRSEKPINTILQHHQEVCGLGLSNNSNFLASGGNDNKLYIYDYRNLFHPLKKCSQHKAAVKAISWSPLSNHMLVSGGGTADKTVKLWDTNLINSNRSNSCLIKSVNYGSQVCNLKWLKCNKILSTHGYSKDDIRLAQVSSFKVEKYFLGHKNRVIHFSCSEDEKYFVTGSYDSYINFWELDCEKDEEIKIR